MGIKAISCEKNEFGYYDYVWQNMSDEEVHNILNNWTSEETYGD